MNSLSLGFFYVCGLAWALAECCVQASAGNSLPLIIFAIAFIVIFAIFGCLDVSDKAINLTGIITASDLGLVLLGFSLASCKTSGAIVGVPKVFFALMFLLGSFSGILAQEDSSEAGEH